MYLGKSGSIREKVVKLGKMCLSSGKSSCIREKLSYSDILVVFGKKWLYSGKSGCIRAKEIYCSVGT